MSQSRKQTPSDFLKQIIGRPVVVKLNSGIDYRGLSSTHWPCNVSVTVYVINIYQFVVHSYIKFEITLLAMIAEPLLALDTNS